MTSRRAVLQGAFGVAVSASVPHAFAAETIAVVPIGSKSALLTGAGGNVLACSTTDGLVVVDSGATAASAMLMDVLGGLADGARTNTLFNTHWHHDQIGGNGSIGETGATIIAHEKTRQRLAVGYYLPEEDRYEAPVPDKGLPSRSFYTTGASTIGGQRVEYGYLLEAHTDGDCYVYFRDTNVIAVGDAVSPTRDPELDWFGGGWLGGRLEALDLLLAITDDRSVFVPSYGPAVGRAAVQAERDMMQKLFEHFFELVRKGDGAEDIFAAGIMSETGRAWQDPMRFVRAAHKSMWAHHNTLSPDIV